MTETASFCMNCGTALHGARFCTSCGATAGSPPAAGAASNVLAPPSDDRIRNLGLFCLVASAGLMIGSFLPWAKITAPFIGTVTKSGIEGGDGWFSVIAALAIGSAGLSLLTRGPRAGLKTLVIVAALAAGALAIFEYSDISNRFADARAEMDSAGSVFGVSPSDMVATTYGAGLHVITASAVGALVVGLQLPGRQDEI